MVTPIGGLNSATGIHASHEKPKVRAKNLQENALLFETMDWHYNG